jgi:hypothetical protein
MSPNQAVSFKGLLHDPASQNEMKREMKYGNKSFYETKQFI